MINVFIIGSKGIPARYGGFETVVDNLTARKVNEKISYHVSCLAKDNKEFYHNGARCFNVKVGNIGSARAMVYDALSLLKCLRYIKENCLEDCIIYILACRIGPILALCKKKIKRWGIKVFVNPDGHEWKRSKWNILIKAYWRFSERLMVKHSELMVCDSRAMEDYIKNEYVAYKPDTIFASYGADIEASKFDDNSDKLNNWYLKNSIKKGEYYLVVGRFVPENNYEIIIREFMASKTKRKLVIITNLEKNSFYERLAENTEFENDKRIIFAGTLYDSEFLKKVRENAFAYIHGHEVGGTNPSLLEALASTKISLLYNVIFNREVAQDSAFYFDKKRGSLADLIEKVERIDIEEAGRMASMAKSRINNFYSWDKIVAIHEATFLNGQAAG